MSLFRMPLFFLVSGVFFSDQIKPKLFIIKKAEALLKPYFSVLLLIYFISIFISPLGNPIEELRGIFYGNGDTIRFGWVPMWFLTHLFAVYCFSYILFHYASFNKFPFLIKWICLFLLLTIGTMNIDVFWYKYFPVFGSSVEIPGLPFSMDIIFISSVFFIAGNILKKNILNFIPNNILLSLSIIIFLCIAFFTESYISFNYRIYTNPVFASLGAICGIYIMMWISYLISKNKTIKNIFTVLGSSSLYILIFHFYISAKIYGFFENYIANNVGLFLMSIITFLLSISLPLIIKWAVNKNSLLALFFLPFKSNKLILRMRSVNH